MTQAPLTRPLLCKADLTLEGDCTWPSCLCGQTDATALPFSVPAPFCDRPAHDAGKAGEGWSWWASRDAEHYQGPFPTRQHAIDAGRADAMGEFTDEHGVTILRFYITEARHDLLKLADWIDVDRMIEDAEERLADSDRIGAECDEGPWFDCSRAAFADLESRIRQACTDWQAAHSIIYTCRTFSASRNEETVIIPATADERPDSPICKEPFQHSDLCASDIELGTCHAACLDGAPTVDLETGDPVAGPIRTYRYDETGAA